MNREMKDVGLSWLGNIPKHWDLIRCGDLFRQRTAKGRNTEDMLTCSIAGGVVPQKVYEEMTGRKLSKPVTDKDNYRKVLKGDLVYNKMRMWQGAVGYSEYSGVVSPAYVVMSCEDDTATQYSSWLFKSSGFNEQSNSNSSGICDDQNSLSFEVFRQMLMPLPPRSEMAKITTYLCIESHHTDAEIDLLNRKIDLLREQRKAIIFEAVTKGLDPDAPMKDSGVEWLGQVPSSWDIVRFGDVSKENDKTPQGAAILSLSYGKIKERDGQLNDGLLPASFDTYQGVDPGDVVLRLTDLQNDQRSVRVALSEISGRISPAYLSLAAETKRSTTHWLYLTLLCLDISKHLYSLGGGVRQSMKYSDVKVAHLPLPHKKEQVAIERFIRGETAHMDHEISLLAKKIILLQEQRKALIFEAVTGKIDLSNHQPRTTEN